jgi:hypothetical protein
VLLYAQPFVTKGTYRDVSERLEGYLSLSGNVRHLFDLRSGDTS